MKALGAIGLSALCGLAWGQDMAGLVGTAILIPILWHLAQSRRVASAGVVAFYLVTARGIPHGAGIFFAESAPAWTCWGMWIAASMVNAVPWLVLWNQNPRRRLVGMPLALLTTAIPPFGIVGWTNPLLAAGVFFPGTGYAGLMLLLGLILALSSRSAWATAAMLTVSAMTNLAPASASSAGIDWKGIDTEFAGDNSFAALYSRMMALQQMADKAQPGSVIVLGESFLGDYSPSTHTVLARISNQLKQKNSTILAGAQRPSSMFGDYQVENILLAIGSDEGQAIIQRMPVPIGMWRPWSANGFKAHWFGSGTVKIHGRIVAGLICYEELLVWPVLLSMQHSPSILVGSANDWWARDTSIPAIQRQSLTIWGKLFALPTISATNI
jgi:apolipoprotein N-acyltransferase